MVLTGAPAAARAPAVAASSNERLLASGFSLMMQVVIVAAALLSGCCCSFLLLLSSFCDDFFFFFFSFFFFFRASLRLNLSCSFFAFVILPFPSSLFFPNNPHDLDTRLVEDISTSCLFSVATLRVASAGATALATPVPSNNNGCCCCCCCCDWARIQPISGMVAKFWSRAVSRGEASAAAAAADGGVSPVAPAAPAAVQGL
mmetsp:Transcript_32759/g.36767  ORF Transcript_32759/g.36767 Transcript_32759/m.36767 type:complete len:202 (-) Transcript_32759:856-1461(-)